MTSKEPSDASGFDGTVEITIIGESENPPCWNGDEDCDRCTQKCEDELRKRQGLPREGEPGFETSPKPRR